MSNSVVRRRVSGNPRAALRSLKLEDVDLSGLLSSLLNKDDWKDSANLQARVINEAYGCTDIFETGTEHQTWIACSVHFFYRTSKVSYVN
ncbi:hypothetical protein AAHA92_22355 [Salvia divinorum]|uniref:Uncharacterized protein n=1 Tax=Salvia divinorum TaxID=28513 RepID=A0ABD1GPL1_SALDI